MILVSVSQKDREYAQKIFLDSKGLKDVLFIKEKKKSIEFIQNDILLKQIPKNFPFKIVLFKYQFFRVLDDLGEIDSIFVNSDRTLNVDLLLCDFGNKNNIPCIIPSLTVSTRESLITYRLKNPKNFKVQNILTKGFLKLIRRNLIKTAQGYYSFYRVKDVIRILLWNIKINDPWVLGANYPVNIIASCFFTKELLIDNGVEASKIKIELGDSYKELLHYNNSNNEYDICFSFTPYWEHNLESFESSLDKQKIILDKLNSLGFKIAIALHPKCDFNQYKSLLPQFDVYTNRTAEILVKSRILIAFYSSIITWAIYANKPFLIYDPFSYNYTFLNKIVDRELIAHNFEELILSLNKLNYNKDYLKNRSIQKLGTNINL